VAEIPKRDAILGGVGLASWVLYVLACASFSPDDTKVLFPSNDPKTGATVVAMYDRTARTTRALLALPAPSGSSSESFVRSIWTPDGTRVVALWAEDHDVLGVMVMPLSTRQPVRLFTVTDVTGDGPSAILLPPPIVGSSLLFGEKTGIRRLDLETGAVEKKDVDGEPLLVGQGGRVYYGRSLPDQGDKTNRAEFGMVDTTTLALTPLFEPELGSGGEGAPGFAISRDGTRMAVTAGIDKGKDFDVWVFENKKLLTKRPILTDGGSISVGMFQWSKDGTALYFTYRKTLPGDRYQFGVLEVPMTGTGNRSIPLFEAAGKGDGDIFAMQLDISHDGRTLASASTYLQTPLPKLLNKEPARVKPADLALYFIDLSAADRKVTKVPIPPLTVAAR
jgi:hypothetical protein